MAPNAFAAPWKPKREAIGCLLIASLAFAAAGAARADMIATEHVVTSTRQASGDPVQTFLTRSDVAYQLRSLGVDRSSAEKRVAAMTDEEVRAVAGKLDSLPAGGQYVPPVVVGAGAAGGTVGAVGAYAGGAYGGVGYALVLVLTGLAAATSQGLMQTNASDRGYAASNSNPALMDPNRKISEQDCTRPIVFDGGNLRCK